MKKIILAGNAVTAEILHAYLQDDHRYQVVGTTVDDPYVTTGTLEGVPSVGLSDLAARFPPGTVSVIMAMGYDDMNRVRESMFIRLKGMGYTIETYVHPHARVYTAVPLGEGAIVLPSAVVEPHVRVGANTMLWCNTTLAHHCQVDEPCLSG